MTALELLKSQINRMAEDFSQSSSQLVTILDALVSDVDRAMAEDLVIYPVCHHSPASAVQLVRYLQEKKPRVIYIELCEDLQPLSSKLIDCQLPVALQAFASDIEGFPESWSPLSVIAPITEFSAEYQAMAYCRHNPDTELVFVDRSVDHVFQWSDGPPKARADMDAADDEDSKPLHSSAIGLQLGDWKPTIEEFQETLLRNAQVRHYSEWWDQYVEQAIVGSQFETYRQVLFLIGSLFRRLGRQDKDHELDCKRERYMWTRIKTHLKAHKIKARDALFICGAVHGVSEVEEGSTSNEKVWDIPAKSKSSWLFGMIPSSYVAIEAQYGQAAGSLCLAEKNWRTALSAFSLKSYQFKKAPSKKRGKRRAPDSPDNDAELSDILVKAPALVKADEELLLEWCVEICRKARANGYLSTMADGIAIYQTAILLAQLRNRRQPSPYDFQEAAITCLEKNRIPKKRNIQRLCEILLGGDRRGLVGYKSLPALAQDVYDRLAPLGLKLQAKTIQRALVDYRRNPELLPCSDLLWKLHYLEAAVRPIMGERQLGQRPVQESWDISIGKKQTSLIRLGYEGLSVEQVLENRLKVQVYSDKARCTTALRAVEDSLLYLQSPRLTTELGKLAMALLEGENTGEEAPDIFDRIRRLVHYYRASPAGLPEWIKNFIRAGYAHYTTLLPASFESDEVTAEQVAGMLSFIFTMESLALSMGCHRNQLLIAVQQSAGQTKTPEKIALLWAAEWLLGLRDQDSIRLFVDKTLSNPLTLAAFPAYVQGFLRALHFTPLITKIVVEIISKALGQLPDEILYPWLPNLVMGLRPHAHTLVPVLLKEADSSFPKRVAELESWLFPWQRALEEEPEESDDELNVQDKAVRLLLEQSPWTLNSILELVGESPQWTKPERQSKKTAGDKSLAAISGLLKEHGQSLSGLMNLQEGQEQPR
jgi:hypothetical protein